MIEHTVPMERFHRAQCIASLSIEVNTGMVHSRGSVLKLVQTRYGVQARTKKGALAEMKAQHFAKYGVVWGE